MNTGLTGLPPIVSPQTRLLILGSFPGQASLAAQQYYGHPQNHFWRILRAIWPYRPIDTYTDSYQNNSNWLLSTGQSHLNESAQSKPSELGKEQTTQLQNSQ